MHGSWKMGSVVPRRKEDRKCCFWKKGRWVVRFLEERKIGSVVLGRKEDEMRGSWKMGNVVPGRKEDR